jgi:pimeloyl-ACP methyl ester carboxylesterase
MEEQQYQENKKLVLIAPATETERAVNSFAAFLHIDEEVKAEMNNIIRERSGRQPHEISIRHVAQNLKTDVLWIHDEDDDVTPWADAEKIQQDNHPNFQFMLTKGLGHRRIYRDNKVKKAIMEFL